jgi:mono/diheme cytochrome c family protein
VKRIELATLMAGCPITTITVDDPQYEARKRYRACPFADVLALGFGTPASTLAGTDVFLRASDGYDKVTEGNRLAEDGAYLAFGDADLADGDHMRFAPIGPRAADPGPLYLVWTKPSQRDVNRYPWPYALAEIEVADFVKTYPHAIPKVARSDPAWHGFEVFRGQCIACHSINREGGKVGPDLNVPKSVVEYRPVDQIKQYIRNPAFFRYGNMPAHPDLTSADLDGLVAYFRTMKGQKHDPGAAR